MILGLVATLPIYWMILTSLLPTSKLFLDTPVFFPSFDYFEAYRELSTEIPIIKWLVNTGFIAFGCTLCSLLIAIFAAYALSRRRFRGKGLVSFVLFATQMLPEALLLIPLYSLFIGLGLINNLYGLILANTAFVMPIIVWILKGAIDSSIVMAFFHAWNEYLFATTFILDPEKRPASTGLATLLGELATPLDRVMSAAVIYTLPPLIFFLLIQKRIVSGLASGSVKG